MNQPPNHCDQPMVPSRTKKNTWWCSQCGDRIPFGLEGYTDKDPGKIEISWVSPPPPVWPRAAVGSRYARVTKDGRVTMEDEE